MFVAVPIKPFGIAKRRLAPLLDRSARAALGRAIARHTILTVHEAGYQATVVTNDHGVAAFSRDCGADVVIDPGEGLDRAAQEVVRTARGNAWAILHADLPWLSADDVKAALELMDQAEVVIAPAADGGTTLLAATGEFPFSYGAGSFHRHLAAAVGRGTVAIVARPGLALDLDSPVDYRVAMGGNRGRWLVG